MPRLSEPASYPWLTVEGTSPRLKGASTGSRGREADSTLALPGLRLPLRLARQSRGHGPRVPRGPHSRPRSDLLTTLRALDISPAAACRRERRVHRRTPNLILFIRRRSPTPLEKPSCPRGRSRRRLSTSSSRARERMAPIPTLRRLLEHPRRDDLAATAEGGFRHAQLLSLFSPLPRSFSRRARKIALPDKAAQRPASVRKN